MRGVGTGDVPPDDCDNHDRGENDDECAFDGILSCAMRGEIVN